MRSTKLANSATPPTASVATANSRYLPASHFTGEPNSALPLGWRARTPLRGVGCAALAASPHRARARFPSEGLRSASVGRDALASGDDAIRPNRLIHGREHGADQPGVITQSTDGHGDARTLQRVMSDGGARALEQQIARFHHAATEHDHLRIEDVDEVRDADTQVLADR